MSLTLSAFITMIMAIAYFTTKKYLHTLEQFFVYFILVFTYTSFVSVVDVAFDFWDISKKPLNLASFRLIDVVYVPLTILWLIDLLQGAKGIFRKCILAFVYLILLCGADFMLRLFHVYHYNGWNIGLSVIAWVLFIVIAFLAQRLFRILLKKEGVLR